MQEFRYGLRNRPAGLGAVPSGWKRIDEPLDDSEARALTRHGVIVYERALTEAELTSFELTVLADDELREELAIVIALKLGTYARGYLDMQASDPKHFRMAVMDRVCKARPYVIHVGPTERFVRMVGERLAAVVENEPRA